MNWIEYKQKLHDLIEREFGASLMNNTKWMEVIGLMQDLRLHCRVKLVTCSDITEWRRAWSPAPPSYIETSAGPVLTLEIEWMGIEPFQRQRRGALVPDQRIDHRAQLEDSLKVCAIPYAWEGSVIRITGHLGRCAAGNPS
jgi:hypothetical protein